MVVDDEHTQHAMRALTTLGCGHEWAEHDVAKLASGIALSNRGFRRAKCGIRAQDAVCAAIGVTNRVARAPSRTRRGTREAIPREPASLRSNFVLWMAVDTWMAHDDQRGAPCPPR
jgi:hypothetical protein